MIHPKRLLLTFTVAFSFLFGVVSPCAAGPPAPSELAARIDRHLAARWDAEKVKPAAVADDATFARRVYLDLTGRIPTVAEARAFIDDRSSDKRSNLVARLVRSAAYARHWATVWRREWIPQADQLQPPLVDDLERWIADRLRAGVGYDRIVLDLLVASPTPGTSEDTATPFSLLTASEFKPESLAANTTRAFLGINLDCAQCHNHPFARWTREQFWQTAAFFTRPTTADGIGPVRIELAIPETKKTVRPRLLTGDEPNWPATLGPETGRTVLAAWVTAKDNPYFARNAVNRIWANLFGTGLVEPLDDLSEDNAPSHPELLAELARTFAASGFDLTFLIAAIVQSKAYQFSSVVREGDHAEPRLFARAAVRGLTGEQLYDSLRIAAGMSAERDDLDPLNALRERKQVSAAFRIGRSGSAQRSVLQSLSQMNGRLIVKLTDPTRSPVIRAVATAPFLGTKGKLEVLYLAALGRLPTEAESAPLVKYVEKGGSDKNPTRALADIFWVLLNSIEFNTNH